MLVKIGLMGITRWRRHCPYRMGGLGKQGSPPSLPEPNFLSNDLVKTVLVKLLLTLTELKL